MERHPRVYCATHISPESVEHLHQTLSSSSKVDKALTSNHQISKVYCSKLILKHLTWSHKTSWVVVKRIYRIFGYSFVAINSNEYYCRTNIRKHEGHDILYLPVDWMRCAKDQHCGVACNHTRCCVLRRPLPVLTTYVRPVLSWTSCNF